MAKCDGIDDLGTLAQEEAVQIVCRNGCQTQDLFLRMLGASIKLLLPAISNGIPLRTCICEAIVRH